jgi:hypothetical protein
MKQLSSTTDPPGRPVDNLGHHGESKGEGAIYHQSGLRRAGQSTKIQPLNQGLFTVTSLQCLQLEYSAPLNRSQFLKPI